jgi:uncharacterized protein (TIGR02996 family)
MLENADLVAALLQNPDDLATYAVYADWLETQGDPRGELMTVQLALARDPKHKKLHKREQALLEKLAPSLLGDLSRSARHLHLGWGIGHVKRARLHQDHLGEGARMPPLDAVEMAAMLGELVTAPIGRLLSELVVGIVTYEENSYDAITAELARRGPLPALRTLSYGDFTYQDTELNWSTIGDCEPLWPAVPNLRTLRLRSGSMRLANIVLPELRDFETYTGGLDAASLAAIATARWPKIERLHIMCGRDSAGASGGVRELAPLLDGKDVPALRRLGIANFEFGDALAAAIVRAPIVKQLTHLDLSQGTFNDDDARVLADHAEVFAHLEELSLAENFLDDEGIELCSRLAKRVVLADQRADEGRRYAAVYE